MMLIGVTLALASGCASRARNDMYRAKLASEIRVLEDQLYEADYQNRILRDELIRAREAAGMAPDEPSPRPSETREKPAPRLGDPFQDDKPSESIPIPPPINLDDPGANDQSLPEPLEDPESEIPESLPMPVPDESNSDPAEEDTEPAPEPVPPGLDELEVPSISPGLPMPPDAEEVPPGKIEVPPGSKVLRYQTPEIEPVPVPDHLDLHPSLSGGHQFDSDNEIDGLYLVVTVEDENGRTLSLDGFDVDAQLSVVVVDPEDDSEDARVGRWDFTPEEVRQFVRSTPVDGIHIPIAWQDRMPKGQDVIVHIRMAAAEEEMRCQRRLKLEESVAISNWLPRG